MAKQTENFIVKWGKIKGKLQSQDNLQVKDQDCI